MPTIGDAAVPYPNASVLPDVPADMLVLAQWLQRLTDPVPTFDDLPATGNWLGRTLYVVDDDAEYTWLNGSWSRRRVSDSVTVTIPTANTDVPVDIVFDRPFASVPNVVASLSSPVASHGISMVTVNGFRATVRRTTTTNTVVTWVATI